jgi:hypothetical protein
MKTDEEVLEKTTGLAQAVIRVGDGRGFMVERQRQRFVLTAAHCLPRLPPAHPMPDTKKCTYEALLGPLESLIESFIELMSQVFMLPIFHRRTSC